MRVLVILWSSPCASPRGASLITAAPAPPQVSLLLKPETPPAHPTITTRGSQMCVFVWTACSYLLSPVPIVLATACLEIASQVQPLQPSVSASPVRVCQSKSSPRPVRVQSGSVSASPVRVCQSKSSPRPVRVQSGSVSASPVRVCQSESPHSVSLSPRSASVRVPQSVSPSPLGLTDSDCQSCQSVSLSTRSLSVRVPLGLSVRVPQSVSPSPLRVCQSESPQSLSV
uniref:Uncharacterized protein n=1 Tax=Knipowitschia caucasica TaxID=637954 RepID=A0AAV2MFK2_KNICA